MNSATNQNASATDATLDKMVGGVWVGLPIEGAWLCVSDGGGVGWGLGWGGQGLQV